MKRPYFQTVQQYGQTFTSVDYWRPYIDHVWSSKGLGAIHSCVAGLPGTNPVFIVNDSVVIKFFTNLFGFDADQVELTFYQEIQPHLQVPTAKLITHGDLFPPEPHGEWHYPYIVASLVKGISFGEIEYPTQGAQVEAARFSAKVLRVFHTTPLPREGQLAANWHDFEALLSTRRKAIRSTIESLPIAAGLRADLIERLVTMQTPYDVTTTPKLLHGDLNQDHILCEVCEDGSVEFTGVIDFGDVKAGDALYDLVPLHLGLFRADKTLLRVFLNAYNEPALMHDFARRAMDYTIQYESDVLSNWCFQDHQDWRSISTLTELQELIWGV